MKTFLTAGLALVAFAAAASAGAIEIFACEPEWGALAQEIGGDKASVYVATTAFQDPHVIQARPSLLARARRASLVVCTGADLEVGWLPVVLRQSGNGAVQPSTTGYFEAANYVQRLDVPTALDRAAGDVHPAGNPHIQLDPRNVARVAAPLAKRMADIDRTNADFYERSYRDFAKRFDAAIDRWTAQAAALKGTPIVVHHMTFSYLENWLGLRELAQLEPKPGVEPTSTHLAEVLDILKQQPAKMILRTPYNDPRASEFVAERTHIAAVAIPDTVGGSDRAKDLFGLYDDIVSRLLGALK